MNCREKILKHCQTLLAVSEIRTRDLVQLLEQIELTPEEIQHLSQADGSKPYGRNVLFNHPRLEVMIATWTRGIPCAPHDHSVSRSAIRVLQGRSHHRLFKVDNYQLVETLSERKSAEDVIRCAPLQVHAMEDDGADAPLITLHAYSGGIDTMLVYDNGTTMIVSGECGAWVPESAEYILQSSDRIVTRTAFVAQSQC